MNAQHRTIDSVLTASERRMLLQGYVPLIEGRGANTFFLSWVKSKEEVAHAFEIFEKYFAGLAGTEVVGVKRITRSIYDERSAVAEDKRMLAITCFAPLFLEDVEDLPPLLLRKDGIYIFRNMYDRNMDVQDSPDIERVA